MGDTRELLQEEEIEFLLNETQVSEDTGSAPEQLPGDGEITMSGDLDKIELADIFQTLAMSKMEGQLRVRNLIEQHELFFEDGYVRSIPPQRTEIKRIGQRLMHAGLLTIDQLRTALLSQKKEQQSGNPRHLGEILIEEGFVTQDDIQDIFHNQIQEDLFALFTWQHGSFEFYRGACSDPELITRLEQTPRFEVNGVLLEVARRGDEWQRVIDAIGDLDEILCVVPDVEPEEPFEEQYETVMAAIDGQRNVRSLADHTALGLFTFGCIVRDLAVGGFLMPIDDEAVLDVADEQANRGDVKLATITYHMLRKRHLAAPVDLAVPLAQGLQRVGENRWAARVLVACGRQQNDPVEALRLARLARKCDGRSSDGLMFLRSLLQETGADPQELLSVTSDYADALAFEGHIEESLHALVELEQLAPGSPIALNRKAKILAKIGRNEQAIEVLLELAEQFKGPKQRDRLIATYEQILKLDSRRKDIQRALRSLRVRGAPMRIRIAVVSTILIAGGWFGYDSYVKSELRTRLEELHHEAMALIQREDYYGARALTTEAHQLSPETKMFSDVLGLIARHDRKQTEARRAELEERCSVALGQAEQAMSEAEVATAVEIYDSLSEFGKTQKEIDEIIKTRIEATLTKLDGLRIQLESKLPPRPSLLQSFDERLEIVDVAKRTFQEIDLKLANAMLGEEVQERISGHLDPQQRDRLRENSTTLRTLFNRCREILAEHELELDRTRTAQRLTPLFEAARRYEDAHDFDRALEAYRRLSREHPEDDDLKRSFRERVERYATIRRFLQVLKEATDRGDFPTAQGQLRALEQAYPDIPFAKLTKLPLHVSTEPKGASVYLDGELVGTSPALAAYFPGSTVRVRIELDGFRVEETEFTGDTVSNVTSLLARTPAWRVDLGATVDVAPVVDEHGTAVLVDREGRVVALDGKAQEQLWEFRSNDMSGLLPRPTLVGEKTVAIASIDGTVRCFDRRSGDLQWSTPELPTEVGPATAGNVVVLATSDQEIVGLDARSGRETFRLKVEAPVRADLLAIDAATVIVTTARGDVVAVDTKLGKIRWQETLPEGVFATPCAHGGGITVLDVGGRLTTFEAATGDTRWTRTGLEAAELPPATNGRQVYLAVDNELRSYDLKTGKPGPTFTAEDRIAIGPSVLGDNVCCGRTNGLFVVLAEKDLTPRYLLRHEAGAASPAVPHPGGLLIAFRDGSVQEFVPPPTSAGPRGTK